MISQPMVQLAQTVHLSCTNTNNVSNGPNNIPHDPRHLGVQSGASKMSSETMLHSALTVHDLTSRLDYLQTDQNELRLELRHLGVPSGASKMISEPMVRLAQALHLSSTNTNTISNRTERDST